MVFSESISNIINIANKIFELTDFTIYNPAASNYYFFVFVF